VPEPIAAELVSAGKLVHVLERFAPMAPGVFLYYADRRQVMPKLRAFIDHVKSRSHATRRVRTKASRLLKPSKALERVKPWSG
jgi:DNA-binding transcriptional LysR family regulator